MVEPIKSVKMECQLWNKGQYFLGGTKLNFDYPWEVYVTNHDLVVPYFRIYIAGYCIQFTYTEKAAYDYILGLKPEDVCWIG